MTGLLFRSLAAPSVALALAAVLILTPDRARAVPLTPVDLELALVLDLSGSVSQVEFALQRNGYVTAFNDPAVKNAIQALGDAGTGGIAVSVFYFATSTAAPNGQQIGWTQLQSAADSAAFATMLNGLTGSGPSGGGFGLTNIASGIDLGVSSIGSNTFDSSRLTIDVSGDGKQNTNRAGTATCSFTSTTCLGAIHGARDDAATAGITVNGLAIVTDFADLLTYYQNNVITPDGFAVNATSFTAFAPAVKDKIFREITGEAPEPGTLALFAAGLLGLGFIRRRRRVVA
ncbi:MAG: DUF1194 domain-containing protein [Alphaproteobacteria bacterium]